MSNKTENIEALKQSIIDLYQIVKIRKQSDTQNIDKLFLEQEKLSLSSISSMVLIDYIKTHLTLLIDIKVSEKISQIKTNPLEFISYYGTDIPCNKYEKLLRRYESDIRNYIKIENMLKIHIDELNYKQELLQKQLEELKNQSLNFIQTTHSIEYKKKIDELTALVKTYEKHNLKIPLLEKKIKVQKIELDKLDTYYKKQLRSYSRKLEEYEKGIFLNQNLDLKQHIYNNKNYELTLMPNNIKTKSRINHISPPKIINNTIVGHRYSEINLITNNENTINMITKKKMNIFEKIHKNTIVKINKNINKNINHNSNGLKNRNSNEHFESYTKNYKNSNNNTNNNTNNDMLSPSSSFFNNKKTSDDIYDSIEIDPEEVNNKTINVDQNFHKKNFVKSNSNFTYSSSNIHKKNSIKKIYSLNKNNRNSFKIGLKSNLKKIQISKNNLSNKNLTKIPKNIKENIYTLSKQNLCKIGNIKFNRYSSQKQLINNNDMKKNIKENSFNKTFSKIPCVDNINTINNTYNGGPKPKQIKSHRGKVKNFIFNKINNTTILNGNGNINLNGKSPIPIKRSQIKAKSFVHNK